MPTSNLAHLALAALALSGCKSEQAPQEEPPKPLVDNMVTVAAGWFTAGCFRVPALVALDPEHPSISDDERLQDCVEGDPPRRLWISTFEMDRFEVTADEYLRCLHTSVCERPSLTWLGLSDTPDFPALVTFEDAGAFCKWRGKRLPTNAEWQKAARGTDGRMYPWGDEPPTCKQTSSITLRHDGFELPCGHTINPVGSHPAGASPYGVEDLEDNASEWITDWLTYMHPADFVDRALTFTRTGAPPDVVLEYDWSTVKFRWKSPTIIDPQGPPEPREKFPDLPLHATKGGYGNTGISGDGFGDSIDKTRREYAGFRCVRSLPGPPPPEVHGPAPGEFTLPFREPGFVPPGATRR